MGTGGRPAGCDRAGLEPFPFRLNRNGGSRFFVLTRFLHANRYPLRSKTLQFGTTTARLEARGALHRRKTLRLLLLRLDREGVLLLGGIRCGLLARHLRPQREAS